MRIFIDPFCDKNEEHKNKETNANIVYLTPT